MRSLWLLSCLVTALSSATVDARSENRRDAETYQGKLVVSSLTTSLPVTQAVPVEAPGEAQMTKDTKVFLDGSAAELSQIPMTAEITRMVLDADGRSILRIEFRSVK